MDIDNKDVQGSHRRSSSDSDGLGGVHASPDTSTSGDNFGKQEKSKASSEFFVPLGSAVTGGSPQTNDASGKVMQQSPRESVADFSTDEDAAAVEQSPNFTDSTGQELEKSRGSGLLSSFSVSVLTAERRAQDKEDQNAAEFAFEETYYPPKYWDMFLTCTDSAFRRSYIDEAKKLIPLTIPVLLAEISSTSMALIDSIMSGHVSPTDQAAVAVATSIYQPTILFALGFLFALAPIVSQLHGARKSHLVSHQLNQFFHLDCVLCVIIMLVLWFGYDLAKATQDLDPDLADKTTKYLRYVTFSAPPYIIYTTLRGCCEGLSHTVPGMVIGLSALIVHIPVNYVCIYGKLGIPKMGGVGCGISTLAVTWYMAIAMTVYVFFSRKMRKVRVLRSYNGLDFRIMWSQVKMGLPIAISLFFETALFAVVAILLAPLGAVQVAGHNATQSFGNISFQLFISCALATTVRVGRNLGAGRHMRAIISCHVGCALSCFCYIILTALSIPLQKYIAAMYTPDHEEQEMVFRLLKYCYLYEVCDCFQVVLQGVLRGYKDIIVTTCITVGSFWGVGFPIGYLLGLTNVFRPRMGADGFWIGFVVSLALVVVLLYFRARFVQTRPADAINRKIGVSRSVLEFDGEEDADKELASRFSRVSVVGGRQLVAVSSADVSLMSNNNNIKGSFSYRHSVASSIIGNEGCRGLRDTSRRQLSSSLVEKPVEEEFEVAHAELSKSENVSLSGMAVSQV